MTERAKFILRDLPGVAEIEALLIEAEKHRNPEWAPARERADALVPAVSKHLFGLVEDDTWSPPERTPDGKNWAGYDWSAAFRDEAGEPYDLIEHGWDVSDGAGGELRCAERFYRQLICVAEGFMGHLPGVSEPLTAADEKSLEARLRAEASQFKRGR